MHVLVEGVTLGGSQCWVSAGGVGALFWAKRTVRRQCFAECRDQPSVYMHAAVLVITRVCVYRVYVPRVAGMAAPVHEGRAGVS